MKVILINAFQPLVYSGIALNLIWLFNTWNSTYLDWREFRHFCSSAAVTVKSCEHSEVQDQKPPYMGSGTILHPSLMAAVSLNASFSSLPDFHGNQMPNGGKNPWSAIKNKTLHWVYKYFINQTKEKPGNVHRWGVQSGIWHLAHHGCILPFSPTSKLSSYGATMTLLQYSNSKANL